MSEKNDDNFGMWGPQYPPPEKNATAEVKELTPEEKSVSGKKKFNYVPKRPWGLLDVLLAFMLFLFTQVLYTVALGFYVVFQAVGEGADLSNPEQVTQNLLDAALSGPSILISSVLMYASWMFVAYRASFAHGAKSFAKDFWLKFSWKRDIPLGLGIALGLRILEQGLSWVVSQFADLSEAGNTDAVTNLSGFWFLVVAFIVAPVAAPFFEEVFFRGFFLQAALRNFSRGENVVPQTVFGKVINDNIPPLFKFHKAVRHFMYRFRTIIAVLLTSTVFGFMHFQGDVSNFGHWFVVIQTGLIGVLLAVLVLKTKRLGLAIFTHVFFNLSGVIFAVVLGS